MDIKQVKEDFNFEFTKTPLIEAIDGMIRMLSHEDFEHCQSDPSWTRLFYRLKSYRASYDDCPSMFPTVMPDNISDQLLWFWSTLVQTLEKANVEE